MSTTARTGSTVGGGDLQIEGNTWSRPVFPGRLPAMARAAPRTSGEMSDPSAAPKKIGYSLLFYPPTLRAIAQAMIFRKRCNVAAATPSGATTGT